MRGSLMLVVLLVAAGPAAAVADDEPAGAVPRLITPTSQKRAAPGEDRFSHKGQPSLSLRFAVGLRAIAPYDKTVFCGELDANASTGLAPVCIGRAPFSLDLELGIGVARKIDAFLEIRLGLQKDFDGNGPRVVHLSPGARFFFSDAGRSKLFTTVQLVIDASDYKDGMGERLGADVGVRNLSGLWFDLDRAFGFYLFVGETLTLARWARFELEGGIGVQARFR